MLVSSLSRGRSLSSCAAHGARDGQVAAAASGEVISTASFRELQYEAPK